MPVAVPSRPPPRPRSSAAARLISPLFPRGPAAAATATAAVEALLHPGRRPRSPAAARLPSSLFPRGPADTAAAAVAVPVGGGGGGGCTGGSCAWCCYCPPVSSPPPPSFLFSLCPSSSFSSIWHAIEHLHMASWNALPHCTASDIQDPPARPEHRLFFSSSRVLRTPRVEREGALLLIVRP